MTPSKYGSCVHASKLAPVPMSLFAFKLTSWLSTVKEAVPPKCLLDLVRFYTQGHEVR